jgi:2'-5' RNA ligase
VAESRPDGAVSEAVSGAVSGTTPALPRAADLPTMSMSVRRPVAGDDVVTIGVVVDIPDPLGAFLRRQRAEFGDPLASAIPPHITLLPPTDVDPGIDRAVSDHLAAVAAVTEPFLVKLHGADSFRPVSPVVYVKLETGSESCDDLQRLVRTGPLTRQLPFPYHPHVTVAHHLDNDALDHAEQHLADYRAEFTAVGLGLYEHGRDGVWRLRRRFTFGGN